MQALRREALAKRHRLADAVPSVPNGPRSSVRRNSVLWFLHPCRGERAMTDDDSYLDFEDCGTSDSDKTKIYMIYSKHNDSYLGKIKWYGPWRRYVLEPDREFKVLSDAKCLTEISAFLVNLMEKRKQKK